MNKTQLIEAVAAKTNLSKSDVEKVINTTVKTIAKEMSQGNQVVVVDFGIWEPRKRAARTARNPKTGEMIAIAATTAAVFKPGKALKDAANGKGKLLED